MDKQGRAFLDSRMAKCSLALISKNVSKNAQIMRDEYTLRTDIAIHRAPA